jgi:hypothetical protein
VKNPWMKFYPADWRADPALRSCTIAARGLWIEMLAIMHEAEPYGSLLIKTRRVDKKQLSGLANVPEKECTVLLLELEGMGVFERDDDGTIYSRRMRRDAAKKEKAVEDGKRGGNPTLKGQDKSEVKDEDKAQKLEARSKKDSEASASGADAPVDHRKRLFSEGLSKLATMTGKGPDACRSFVGKCLSAASDDAVVVLGLIEDAERNQVIDPSAWIAARLKTVEKSNGKPKSAIIQAADDLCRTIAGFDGPKRGTDELRSIPREAPPRLLSNG